MASIGEIYREAQGKPNGYSGRRSDTYAVSVAVGPAATSRGHEGQIVVTVEWHVPESISDDDLSARGFLLGPWRGYTRVARQVVLDEIDVAAIRDAVPAIVAAAIEP